MITGELKNKIDNLWDIFASGGLVNPLEVIEQITYLLLEYAGEARDIADPWYTGNFDVTYEDVKEGCEAFLQYLIENEPLY